MKRTLFVKTLFGAKVSMLVLWALSIALPTRADEPAAVNHAAEWDGFRNRLLVEPSNVQQDFGYLTTNHAGGRQAGEIGGRVQRSTVPATYAVPIPEVSLDQPLSASGRWP